MFRIAGRIDTDHECVDYEYAMSEARNGMHVLIREGSAARNLDAIVSGIVEHHTDTTSFCFCTDDKHIEEIRREGHINYNVKRAVQLGLPVEKALQMATIQPARCYGLCHLGMIAPGRQADFEKYDGNPLFDAPEGIQPDSFRDPKVWRHENKYYMVVGASRNNRGLALIYESEDLYHWNFLNVLAESRGEWGFMWECPDFYQLGDKYVLTFSPMGSGDHTSVYLTGDFDYKTGKFDWHISGEMDWGFDFYAPQSMVAPDGRRLIVAWANEWEWMPLFKDWGPTYQEGWCGFFNVIREVRMCKDGTLAFVPVEEMEKIRENKFTQREIQVTETPQQLKAGDGISFEMKFTLDFEETDADRVELKLRCGKEKETRCIFDLKNGELLVDRSCADGWSVGTSRSVLKVSEKSLDVHIFSDQSSLEIFTDQYRNNHSNNIFAGNDQDAISISAFGGRAVIKDYEAYGLQECFN